PAYAEAMPAYAEAEAYAYGQEPYYYPENYGMQDSYTSGDDRFFNASDEELEKWSRGLAKQQRKHRNIGLKVFLVIIILLFLALGTAVFAYTQGFGYPAQETVVKELFADPQAAAQSLFSSDVSNAQEKVVPVVKDTAITIEGMDKSMGATTVYVTAKTEQGALVQYKVELVRDLIGWKVLDVEMYFSSMTTG
ncbi:MAG: hypothetical protein LBG81_08945, partial [Coriobacteriaceae bacterium]|nr:hypothetical protein [Coriobacteriaceae bacterium]